MTMYRLSVARDSVTSGGCPALYGTDDDARMIGQGKKLSPQQEAELLQVLDDETGLSIPTETVFRGVAEYAKRHGDDDLAGRLEAFLDARGM